MRVDVAGVSVSHSGGRRWLPRHEPYEISLNRDVRWEMTVRGGAARLSIDLRGTTLRSVSISGGASAIDLRLGRPDRAVPIRLNSSASRIDVSRPGAVPVAVHVRGSAMDVRLDGARVSSYGETTGRRQTSGARFELELSGAASAVDIASG